MQVEEARDRSADLLAAALTLAGFALTAVLAAQSDGFYMDDDISHYLVAVRGWTHLPSLLHSWGRPGYNLPAALAAHLGGVLGCRLLSAAQTAVVAWLSYRIARHVLADRPGAARFAAIAPALVWLQPLPALVAKTTLTETAALFYLTVAGWLYLRGSRVIACLVAGLAFVSRYELLGLAAVFGGFELWSAFEATGRKLGPALLRPRLWACAVALIAIPLAYLGAAAWFELPPGYSPLDLFHQRFSTWYGAGSSTHFLIKWVEASGIGVLAFAAAGAVYAWRRAAFPIALCVGLVAIETAIFVRGSFASGGYPRFLVPIAGLTASIAAAGLAALVDRRRPVGVVAAIAVLGLGFLAVRWYPLGFVPWSDTGEYGSWRVPLTVVAVVLGMVAIAAWRVKSERARRGFALFAVGLAGLLSLGYGVHEAHPLRLMDPSMHKLVVETLRDVAAGPYADTPAFTSHPLIGLLRPRTDFKPMELAIPEWERAAPGTLIFWDGHYSPQTPGVPDENLARVKRRGELVLSRGDESWDHVDVYALQAE